MQDKIILYKGGGSYTYDLNDIIQGEVLFTFKEYEYVKLRMISKSNYCLHFDDPADDGTFEVKDGDYIILNDFQYHRHSSENLTYFPSTYVMEVMGKNIYKQCFFKVESNALGNQVEDIRKIVYEYQELLPPSICRPANMGYSKSKDEALIEGQAQLQALFSQIKVQPDVYMTKEAGGFKAFKMKMLGKPLKQELISYHSYQNQALKQTIDDLVELCHQLRNQFQNAQTKNRLIKTKIKNQLVLLEVKKGTTPDLHHLKKIQRDYRDLELQFNQTINEEQKIHQTIHQLEIIQTYWLNALQESFLRSIVPTNQPFHTPLDGRYEAFSTIVYHILKPAHQSYLLTQPTGELYEWYVLILIIHILEKEYFVLEESNGEFVYIRQDKRVRLFYDQEIPFCDDDFEGDCIINQNSNSHRPDVLMMIYEQDILKHTIIFEAKCRRYFYIYKEDEQTDVYRQLKDYTNFWYCDASKKVHKGAIDMVYALFPNDEPIYRHVNLGMICLLSLKPTYHFSNDESYLNLVSEITQYL